MAKSVPACHAVQGGRGSGRIEDCAPLGSAGGKRRQVYLGGQASCVHNIANSRHGVGKAKQQLVCTLCTTYSKHELGKARQQQLHAFYQILQNCLRQSLLIASCAIPYSLLCHHL